MQGHCPEARALELKQAAGWSLPDTPLVESGGGEHLEAEEHIAEHEVWNCGAGAGASSFLEGNGLVGCWTCGCSSHVDAFNDRMCYCDSCWTSWHLYGCTLALPVEGFELAVDGNLLLHLQAGIDPAPAAAGVDHSNFFEEAIAEGVLR